MPIILGRAATQFKHARQRRLSAVERSAQNDVHRPLPHLAGQVSEGEFFTWRWTVDQDIDRAKLLSGLRHHRVDGAPRANIGKTADGAYPERAHVRGRLIEGFTVAHRVDYNVGAGLSQRQSDRPPQALARTCHQRHLASERHLGMLGLARIDVQLHFALTRYKKELMDRRAAELSFVRLRVLLVVVRTGSVTRAAEALFMSQRRRQPARSRC